MTALVRPGSYVSEAYADWSHWVARCGACRPGAGLLQRFAPNFQCDFCGAVTEVIWPAESIVAGVERLLMMRPDPSTRNWKPGETLSDLVVENAVHGIFDNLEQLGLTATPGKSLLSVDDERIRVDRLPSLKPRIRQEIPS